MGHLPALPVHPRHRGHLQRIVDVTPRLGVRVTPSLRGHMRLLTLGRPLPPILPLTGLLRRRRHHPHSLLLNLTVGNGQHSKSQRNRIESLVGKLDPTVVTTSSPGGSHDN